MLLKTFKTFNMRYIILLSFLITSAGTVREVPEGFLFGATSSAYQFEGAWNEDGKGPSIWDDAIHKNPSTIFDGTTGDVATDTYHLYKNDVKILNDMGLDFYRFSFSWPRILPTGFPDKINEPGIEYYNNFIDELLKHNITPHATLYHWDLPVKLQDLGGWTNPDIVQWFLDYAKVVFDNFGNKIKVWTTINEGVLICSYGYALGVFPPYVISPGIGEYMCIKNVLLAHARTYRLYHESYDGVVGIALNPCWATPRTASQEDLDAASDSFQFSFDIIINPILSESGDYPEDVKRRVAAKSAEQGFSRSRLPDLTGEEIEIVKGSADFLGINYYDSVVAFKKKGVSIYPVPSLSDDTDADLTITIWPTLDLFRSYNPSHFYNTLMRIRHLYNNPTVYITENGWSNNGGLEDDDRIEYLVGHIDAVLNAIDQGCDIRSYSVWSLLDNFEWNRGYTKKFGLYEVDFSSPNLTRTPRKSSFFYKNVVQSRTIPFYNNTFLYS